MNARETAIKFFNALKADGAYEMPDACTWRVSNRQDFLDWAYSGASDDLLKRLLSEMPQELDENVVEAILFEMVKDFYDDLDVQTNVSEEEEATS